jgi:3-deoxy-D-manno-octulosonic-acid transferase
LPCNNAECDDLARLLGGRPVWLAADFNGSEIGIVEAAHRKAFKSAHRLLLILVPAQGQDPDAMASMLEEAGWRVVRRSNLEEPDPEIQVYIADTEDELGLWYRLAPASFIGGTLQPDIEPTDPFHAAALGSAVLTGPNHGQNPSRFRQLEAHGASIPVTSADELGEAIVTLLSPDKAASLAQAGWAATTESAHVVERLAEVIVERLTEMEGVN